MRERNRLSGWVVLALILGLLLTTAGPAVAKKPGVPPGKGDDADGFDTAVGRRLYQLALARGGEELSLGKSGRYLRAVFEDLASSARRQRKLDYSLHVLSSRERIDAWVLPDGSVFVTVGLLRRLPSEDEVAGVLAHQLAHAVLRHNLDELTSPEAVALLADLYEGKVPPVRERLGRYGIALLGEYYSSAEEKAADSLARGLLRQNSFRESGVETSFRRVAGRPLPAYLMVHPHPNLQPLPKERDLPPIIIIEIDEPAAPPPPVIPPPPPVQPEQPLPPPARVQRVATPERQVGLEVLAGLYPLSVEASSATVHFTDDWAVESPLALQTGGTTGGATLGAFVETPFGRDWEGAFGGGWVTADVFTGRPRGNGGFVLAGVLRRGSVDGEGMRWAVGPYLSFSWASVDAGVTADQLQYDEDGVVEVGSRITATAVSPGIGALLTVSGDTPRSGISWFATVGGQVSNPGAWTYSSTVYASGQTVNLPFHGQNAAPLSTTGYMALGGLVFRF